MFVKSKVENMFNTCPHNSQLFDLSRRHPSYPTSLEKTSRSFTDEGFPSKCYRQEVDDKDDDARRHELGEAGVLLPIDRLFPNYWILVEVGGQLASGEEAGS